MGMFMVHFMVQRAIGSPINIYVKEGRVAISFHLCDDLNVPVDTSGGQGSPSACRIHVTR
jgi:hypothetical protein